MTAVSSRAIEDLHPEVQPLARAMVRDCAQEGIDLLITCTWRNAEAQEWLYASSRTRPGPLLTNARAGESAHNFMFAGRAAALAFDVLPLRNGKPVWGLKGNGIDNDPSDDQTDDRELWERVRRVGERLGLESASRWKGRLVEWPHFQHRNARDYMRMGALT